MEAVLEGFAEYYGAQLAQNVRRGLRGNALKCRHNGVRCYGYDLGEDGLCHVNEEQAAMVRRVFCMYLDGVPIPQIVAFLGAVRSITGRPLCLQAVSKMLRNEKYVGTYRYAGVVAEGGVPAIVEREAFEAAQRRLSSRSRRRRDSVDYLLTVRLFDEMRNGYSGSCGYGRLGKKYSYYRCSATGHVVPRDEIEAAAAGFVRDALRDPGAADRIADAVLPAQDKALRDDLAAMGPCATASPPTRGSRDAWWSSPQRPPPRTP